MNRRLTDLEKNLVRWMLEHGNSEAETFLAQLQRATVTPWRCKCGCASFELSIEGHPKPSGGIHPLADFIVGSDANMSGIFVYEQSGILSVVEVYGMSGHAAKSLPSIKCLRPKFESK